MVTGPLNPYPMSSATSPPIPTTLTSPSRLTLPKEETYFVFALLVSIVVWAALAFTIIGMFYVLIFAFFLWMGNGLLCAHLRSESVRVTEQQLPQLYAAYLEVCTKLNLARPPALYVLQSGGMLNAFATRHAGRSFVVVYSDFVDVLGADSAEMKFILGHEIGHLRSRHLLKQILLAPGLFMPLLGPAYRRSWESSCDRHGAYAAQDIDASARAMMVLSGSKGHGPQLNADVFAGQHVNERGFFVSLHELASTYPTHSKRVTDLLALKTGLAARRPTRNPFAYLFAIFVPGGKTGAPANAMIFIVIIGLLAAMAIPAFQKVRQASQLKVCVNNERMLSAAFNQYLLEEGKAPTSLSQLVGPDKYIKQTPVCLNGGKYVIPPGAHSGDEITCTVHGTMEDIQRAFQSRPGRR